MEAVDHCNILTVIKKKYYCYYWNFSLSGPIITLSGVKNDINKIKRCEHFLALHAVFTHC